MSRVYKPPALSQLAIQVHEVTCGLAQAFTAHMSLLNQARELLTGLAANRDAPKRARLEAHELVGRIDATVAAFEFYTKRPRDGAAR